jgi:hypothetical protein
MFLQNRFGASLASASVAVLLATPGCQILAGFDRIDTKGAANTASSASSTSSTNSGSAGMGGMGGMADASSTMASTGSATGGGGGGGGCSKPEDCPPPNDVCLLATCEGMICGTTPEAKGVACGNAKQCDGAGNCADGGCLDNAKAANETDVDCGGACAKKCADTQGCNAASDCTSGYCDLSEQHGNGSNGICTACTVDSQCPGKFCDATLGKCLSKKGQGAPCTKSSACASTFCVDEVCCESACTGDCRACASKFHGANDGSCLLLGGVPGKNDACGAFHCNGVDSTCPTSCVAGQDSQCVQYCDQDDLKCYGTSIKYGEPCDHGNECEGGHYCVDSTCCTTATCNAGETCNTATGMCAPL